MKSMFLSLFMMLLVLHLSAQVQPYTLTISSARVLHTNLVSLTFAVSTNYIWPYGLPPDTEWQIQTAPCGVRRPNVIKRYIRDTSLCIPHESCSILDSVAKSIDPCSAVTPLATRWTEPPP